LKLVKPYQVDIELPSTEDALLDMIDTTGVYYRKRLACWEIWVVRPDKTKEKVGYSAESLGIDATMELWEEFCFIVENEITSIRECCDPEEIH